MAEPLTCAFGTPWLECIAARPCAACRAETDRMLVVHRATVSAGEHVPQRAFDFGAPQVSA